MHLSPEGLELRGDDEVIAFFNEHCEMNTVALYSKSGMVMGDITAITNDNRFVLDVDVPGMDEFYSAKFSTVMVKAEDDGAYHLTITG